MSNTIHVLLSKFNCLKIIGMVLIKYTLIWEETSAHEVIINDLIKLMLVYSQHKSHLSIPQVNCIVLYADQDKIPINAD